MDPEASSVYHCFASFHGGFRIVESSKVIFAVVSGGSTTVGSGASCPNNTSRDAKLPNVDCAACLQFIQVTDPAIIAEALRSRELDKKPLAGGGINNFASPKGYLSLLTSPSNERWKAVRCFSLPLCWSLLCISLVITDHRTSRGGTVWHQ